jgi:hypothetical protein
VTPVARPPALVSEAVAVLGRHGRTADVDLNGAHFKIRWTANNGRQQLLVVSRSPSDHRAAANARALLRRLLREEGRSSVG